MASMPGIWNMIVILSCDQDSMLRTFLITDEFVARVPQGRRAGGGGALQEGIRQAVIGTSLLVAMK